MALRIIEIVMPSDMSGLIRKTLDEHPPVDVWRVAETEEGGRRVVLRALVDPDYQQATLDALHDALSGSENWRIVLQPVDAAIPRPEPDEEGARAREEQRRSSTREVLYHQVEKGARIDADYLLFVALSTLVAVAALVTDNVAVLIGAMVIAPFLGPNLAFSFGAALGDGRLMAQAIKGLLLGFGLTLVISTAVGAWVPVNLEANELLARTTVGLDGIVVALASGACAAVALTSGVSASLVGVMVAVALLPPASAIGIMLGAGRLPLAFGAFTLLIANIACVNLAALAVFRWRRIEPRQWLRKFSARQSRLRAYIAWGMLVLILVVMILIRRHFGH